MTPAKLTVLVPTFNCELHLRQCLDSVKWADEILICDSGSTDGTLAICREYTDHIIQHEYINSARQKNWAIPQAAHEWVLIIDSDEFLEDALQQEIKATLAGDISGCGGFRIPRKNLVFGKWAKSCRMYPDYNLRLFRKSSGRYQDKEVHAHVTVDGQVGTLTHAFVHHDFEDVVATLAKWSRYSRYEGDEMVKVGRSYRWYSVTLRPLIVFLYFYFFTGGIWEGYRGFYLSAMWAFYVFAKHSRLWELEWRRSPAGMRYWGEQTYEL